MKLKVKFWSYFRDHTGCEETTVEIDDGATLADLMTAVYEQFPKLTGTEKCTLKAVGVEYQDDDYILNDGDEVSLFPPVQGG
jgi:MoaD family protein